jgi:hypothetical protein
MDRDYITEESVHSDKKQDDIVHILKDRFCEQIEIEIPMSVSSEEDLYELSEEELFDQLYDEQLENSQVSPLCQYFVEPGTAEFFETTGFISDGQVRVFRYRCIQDDADEEEEDRTGTTTFKRRNFVSRIIGDYPLSRFWSDRDIEVVDATNRSTCQHLARATLENNQEEIEDRDNNYVLKLKDYNIFYDYLSPAVKEREFGKVYFHSATHYIAKDIPTVLTPKLSSPETFVVHQHPAETFSIYGNFRRNPRKPRFQSGVPGGILKVLTVPAARDEYWKNRFNFINKSKTHPVLKHEIRPVIFKELLKYNQDFQHWFENTTSLIQPDSWIEFYKTYQHLYKKVDRRVTRRLDVLKVKRNLAVRRYNTFVEVWRKYRERRIAEKAARTNISPVATRTRARKRSTKEENK